MNYDSTSDTQEHINKVREFLAEIKQNLAGRSNIHDLSKLQEPEKSMYDEFTPRLRASTYGSDEYKAMLEEMGVALKHHYENNSHHPEHYKIWHCPLCESIFKNKDAPIDIRFEGEVRLCPKCCEHGSIMEATLEPASGIYGMSLLDVIEMLADWKAAVSRHADGDIQKSLIINKERFAMSDQLFEIMQNTIRELGW